MPSSLLPNRSMPACTIIPVLEYEDVREAMDWLCKTFGFIERWRVGNHRAQLMFDSGAIVISEQRLANTGNIARFSLMVRVRSVDGHHEHVRQCGARIIDPPADYPYGERQYSVLCIGGHVWTFSQSINDLAPEDWGGVTAR